MRTTIWHLFLVWLIADLTHKSLVDRNFKPLIHDLLKTTRLAQKASRVVSSRDAEI